MTKSIAGFFILCCLFLLAFPINRTAHASIDKDGICALATFISFTYDEVAGTGNLGFSHMAAAVMAMEHFNKRNASVVPELAQNVYRTCNVKFDLSNQSRFFDTGIVDHTSTRLLVQAIHDNGGIFPCAIAGPHDDLPAQLLSTMAASFYVPLVAHRAYNLRVTAPYYSPFSNQVYPDQFAEATVLKSFLTSYAHRYNYTALLHSVLDASTQRQQVVQMTLEASGFK